MIIAIHLASGQTILGGPLAPVDEEPNGVRVRKPMSLIVQPGGAPDKLAVSMLPFLSNGVFPTLEEFEFEQQHILFVREVPAQLEKMYHEMTSGITIAGANSKFAL